MATEQVDHTVVTQGPTVPTIQGSVTTESVRTTQSGPDGAEYARRVIILVFGLIQLLIGARIVLLLLDARPSNDLVAGILDLSQVFVAPFEGVLRTDALHAGGSTLDIAAVVALVGWTVVEMVLIWATRIFRREPA